MDHHSTFVAQHLAQAAEADLRRQLESQRRIRTRGGTDIDVPAPRPVAPARRTGHVSLFRRRPALE